MIEHFIGGFMPLTQWNNILAIVGGSVVGYLVGALPGLSATMGIALYEGLPLIPLLIGLFAISEVLMTMEELSHKIVLKKISGSLPTLKEYLSCHRAMVKGTLIGYFIGIIPGRARRWPCSSPTTRRSVHPDTRSCSVRVFWKALPPPKRPTIPW